MKYLSLWPNERQLRRSNPFDLMKQFDNFFLDFDSAQPERRENFYPALDIEETDKDFVVNLDIPGLKREDIKVEVKDQTLFISGERKREEKSERNGVSRTERSYGQFTRSLHLPHNVDATKIEAKYEDGVLKLTVPKSADAQPRLVDIK